MVKTLKIFSGTNQPISIKLWYVAKKLALGTLAHDSLYKSWPWVDLDLFYSKVNFGYIGFSMETLNFSGSIVACNLKVGRYRQHVELIKLCEYSRSKSFLDLGQRSFTYYM